MENLNEIFAPPVGLIPISVLGSKLHTSILLRKSYLFSMSRVQELSQVMGKIKELTDNKMIIPCFLIEPGIIKKLLSRMFISDKIRAYDQYFREEMKNVFGFFNSGNGKIYLLINNKELKINKFGFVNNEKIAKITIHEAAHMAASKNPSGFMKKFSTILLDYYKLYFKKLFSLESVNDEIINKMIKMLFYNFENSRTYSNKDFDKYRNILLELKESSTAQENFDKLIKDFFVVIFLFLESTAKFITKVGKFRNILGPLQSTYREIFGGIDPGNIAIQELLFPSEVIAIGSEIGNNKKLISGIFRSL